MTKATIAIIGGGNMGASLLGGLIAEQYPRDQLWITDSDTTKLSQLQTQFQIHTTQDNAKAIAQADVVIIAVKPQVMGTVLHDLAQIIQQKKPLIISIAAGVGAESMQKWLGGNIAIIRAMPNTPALIGCGATGLYANAWVSTAQRELAESILSTVSIVIWVATEQLIDTVTALSGSGPAYFFLMIEALQDAAEGLGLTADDARRLTVQTALGAARMALESDVSVKELRKRVTSPGGTTEEAVRVLEEKNIRDMFKHALKAAKNRSAELAELLDKKT